MEGRGKSISSFLNFKIRSSMMLPSGIFDNKHNLKKIFKQANNAPLLLSLCSKSSSSSQSSCMFGAFFLSDWGVHVSCVLPTEIAFTLVIILMITSVTCWYMLVGGFQHVLNSGGSFSILVSDWVTDWLGWSDSSRRWRQLNTANCGQPDDSFTICLIDKGNSSKNLHSTCEFKTRSPSDSTKFSVGRPDYPWVFHLNWNLWSCEESLNLWTNNSNIDVFAFVPLNCPSERAVAVVVLLRKADGCQ